MLRARTLRLLAGLLIGYALLASAAYWGPGYLQAMGGFLILVPYLFLVSWSTETPDVTVSFDPALCQHTGICLRGLPDVFDVHRKRWVRPELADADAVVAQVARCPSGELRAVRHRRDEPV